MAGNRELGKVRSLLERLRPQLHITAVRLLTEGKPSDRDLVARAAGGEKKALGLLERARVRWELELEAEQQRIEAEGRAFSLVNHLRGNPDGSVARVLRLIQELANYRAITPQQALSDRRKMATLSRMLDLQNEIHTLLSNYEFQPSINLKTTADSSTIIPAWYPLLQPLYSAGAADRASESVAIADLMSVVETGEWERMRLCPVCQRWFYARSKKKSVCSDSCRFRKYQASEEGKATRRKYMRDYYQNPKVKARLRQKRQSTDKRGL